MPRFRKAPHYDPLYHVQHLSLPAGSSDDDLLRLVADLHEPMLDRDRPLFRDWFIDGVPGGRFALYAKVHHGIIDGVSGVQRIYAGLNSHASAHRTAPRVCRRPARSQTSSTESADRKDCAGRKSRQAADLRTA